MKNTIMKWCFLLESKPLQRKKSEQDHFSPETAIPPVPAQRSLGLGTARTLVPHLIPFLNPELPQDDGPAQPPLTFHQRPPVAWVVPGRGALWWQRRPMDHPVSPRPAHSTARGSSAPAHGPGGRRGEASGAVWGGARSELWWCWAGFSQGSLSSFWLRQSPLHCRPGRGTAGTSFAQTSSALHLVPSPPPLMPQPFSSTVVHELP